MKKFFSLFILLFQFSVIYSQEILAEVSVNYQQVQGSNTQIYKTLEKSLRDFINNTSWTGQKLQNFEKIKSNFAIVINSREGNNFKASLVVQATRPVYNSTYNSPLMNINDRNFSFEYSENENIIFNERQFSGKNLTDVIAFYVYLILGYDADSFKPSGGKEWFDKALKISQNAQNQKYNGWAVVEGPRTRSQLIDNIIKPENATLRNVFYTYHRVGLDNLARESQSMSKKTIFDALLKLRVYENNFGMNYPFAVFMQTKSNEIYEIFNIGNNNNFNINDLRNMMLIFEPNNAQKWNKWK